jgi:hypothetical protein
MVKNVAISTRDLKIWYVLDGMSADQISENLNEKYSINCSGEDIVKLLRDRGIQSRNVKRTGPNFQFTDPDKLVQEELPLEQLTNN